MATVNFNSINSCKQAYVNYVLRGNSCGYDACTIGKITAMYADRLDDWEANPDTTEYEITDEEWDVAYNNGQKYAMKTTGFDGDRTTSNIQTATDGAIGLGTVGCGGAASLGAGAGKQVGNWVGEKAIKEAGEKAVKEAGEEAVKEAGEEAIKKSAEQGAEEAGKISGNDVFWMATCAATLVAGLKGKAEKANEEEANACEKMVEVQNQTVAELGEKAQEMEQATRESQELSDEANAVTEESNDELENKKTDYDMARDTIEAIQAKIDNGVALTEGEKALWKECMAIMTENSGSIATIQEDTNSTVEDLNGQIADKQESYDNVAEGMAYMQGLTKSAAEYDEATAKASLWEGVNQTATAAGGALAVAKGIKSALASTAVWWVAAIKFAVAATGAAGAALCGFNAAKQFEYRGKAQNEIDVRHATEDINEATNDIYESNLEDYASNIETVEDLELEIPDDMELPEEPDIPDLPVTPDGPVTPEAPENNNNNSSVPGFGLPNNNQNDNNRNRLR